MEEIIKYIEEREKNLRKYSEKLRKALDIFSYKFAELNVSVSLTDDEPFCVSDEKEYYLRVIPPYLVVRVIDKENETTKNESFLGLDREVLKALIKSKRLVPFLRKIAEVLKEKEMEYKEVAEIAEKIASVIA